MTDRRDKLAAVVTLAALVACTDYEVRDEVQTGVPCAEDCACRDQDLCELDCGGSTCAVDCGEDCDVRCAEVAECRVAMRSGIATCEVVEDCIIDCIVSGGLEPAIDCGGGVFACGACP